MQVPSSGELLDSHGFIISHSTLPVWLPRLLSRGYEIEAQARHSSSLANLMDRGVYAIYKEKSQAGLTVLDRAGSPLSIARHPQLIYEKFEDIPSIIVETLLFIENRSLLDPQTGSRSPRSEVSQ